MLSTHVLPEVEQTCRRIIVIHQGKIVADGSTEELLARARGMRTIVVELEGTGAEAALARLPGVQAVGERLERQGRTRLSLSVAPGPDPRPEIFKAARDNDWVLWELHEETGSLQDLFSQLTR